jgi:hypothetical protein
MSLVISITICRHMLYFFDIETTFDTVWNPGVLHKLSELQFSSLINFIVTFLITRKCKISVEGELFSPK